ncbi:hypothetical protein BH09SUM1_BH09SUM1_28910 [soil metagenome]
MIDAQGFEWSYGGVIRAPRNEKRIALIFTGGDFGEGNEIVLDALQAAGAKGSFFFTGTYMDKKEFRPHIERIVREGHYLAPHSHGHLLYAPWDNRDVTLVNCEEFRKDLEANLAQIAAFGVPRENSQWWIPPFEWYNDQISMWSREMGMRLFNFSPGTLSNADYTEDDDKKFRSSETIYKSILNCDDLKPNGLSGFLLLSHVGSSPKRTDKFYLRLGTLLKDLKLRGYSFSRVDELLAQCPLEPPKKSED